MNLTKLYSYKSSGQIWRILISDNEKLVMETRDRSSKEVSIQCFNLFSGEKVFTDFQLEEKHWIGIETIYKDVILFHKFGAGHSCMVPALYLVVALFGDCPNRAPLLTASARTVVKKEAVRVVIVIGPCRYRDRYVCDHRTNSVSLALRRDKSVAESECS